MKNKKLQMFSVSDSLLKKIDKIVHKSLPDLIIETRLHKGFRKLAGRASYKRSKFIIHLNSYWPAESLDEAKSDLLFTIFHEISHIKRVEKVNEEAAKIGLENAQKKDERLADAYAERQLTILASKSKHIAKILKSRKTKK